MAIAGAAGVPPGRTALLGAAVLAGQLSIGWANDWLDAAADRRGGRADKPVATGAVSSAQVRAGAFGAAGATLVLSLALGVRPGCVHLVAVAAGWAYDAGLKRTVASPLPYALAFGLVPPVLVAACLPGSPAARPATVAASALLGVAAHFANTVGDTEADRRNAVRGLPQRLGPVASVVVSAALVGVGAALLAYAAGGQPVAVAGAVLAVGLAVLALVAVALSRARGRAAGHAAFRYVLASAAVVVVTFALSGGAVVVAG